jgi:hypothetical protein
VPFARHEVGDHRLVRGAADLEGESAGADEPEPDELAIAGGQEAQDERDLEAPRGEDQRPPAEVVGEVAAEVARGCAEERADQEGEADRRLVGVQALDRPDADEAPDGRAAGRAREADREHRPERPVDVGSPDEAEQAPEEAPHPREPGLSVTS